MQNIQSSAAELKLGQLLDLVYDPKVNISDHDDELFSFLYTSSVTVKMTES